MLLIFTFNYVIVVSEEHLTREKLSQLNKNDICTCSTISLCVVLII